MPYGVIPQHYAFYAHTKPNTHWLTHAHTDTRRASPLHRTPTYCQFGCCPLLLFLGRNSKQDDITRVPAPPYPTFASSEQAVVGQLGGSAPGAGSHPRTAALHNPVVRAHSSRPPCLWLGRAAPRMQPRSMSAAPLSSLRSPCNKKSRLWRHTMWKGGRFKKKNASKNNKSQL